MGIRGRSFFWVLALISPVVSAVSLETPSSVVAEACGSFGCDLVLLYRSPVDVTGRRRGKAVPYGPVPESQSFSKHVSLGCDLHKSPGSHLYF